MKIVIILSCFLFIFSFSYAEKPFSHFLAYGDSSQVQIYWDYTGDLTNLIGCNLLRTIDPPNNFSQINDDLILSDNNSFSYIDENEISDYVLYFYRIEYVFTDTNFVSYYDAGALREISLEAVENNNVRFTCVPRQPGSYSMMIYRNSELIGSSFFTDFIVFDQESNYPSDNEFRYEFINLIDLSFCSFHINEYYLNTILNPANSQDDIIISILNLHQNYPNPFNPNTKIRFDVSQPSNVSLSIFNNKGQFIKTLVDSYFNIGTYEIVWDGCDKNGFFQSSGIYYYQLRSKTQIKFKKMVLLK